VVLAFAPLVLDLSPGRWLLGLAALAAVAAMSAMLGLLLAARIRSVENFAGIINVVLFPLLFLSGALYPTDGMPAALRAVARANPVTYAVDLVRHALGQPAEVGVATAAGVVLGVLALAFGLAALLFDPEQRFFPRRPAGPQGISSP
jgi:ABC-2 type transport system permease protein